MVLHYKVHPVTSYSTVELKMDLPDIYALGSSQMLFTRRIHCNPCFQIMLLYKYI